jgi:large conductance mechanosensitive channel
MTGFIQEFKDFAIKGNMLEAGVGILIGASFNNVVNTLLKK